MTAPDAGAVRINPFRRILKQRGALCGGIRTGTDQIRNGYGNGDCLYFDFGNLVFAAADGSERAPWSSRDLLQRLAESLALCGPPDTVSGCLDLVNEKVYAGQAYPHRAAFSCVALRRDGAESRLIVAHGGDSAVAVIDGAGSFRRLTGRDMNFAGRSRAIADVTEYRVAGPDERVLIATDGFDDLRRAGVRDPGIGETVAALRQGPVDGICERLYGALEEGGVEHDDIGLILLDPNRMERIPGMAVLIGGTRPFEEARYRSEYVAGSHDRWLADRCWREHEQEFAGAGIGLLMEAR